MALLTLESCTNGLTLNPIPVCTYLVTYQTWNCKAQIPSYLDFYAAWAKWHQMLNEYFDIAGLDLHMQLEIFPSGAASVADLHQWVFFS